MSNLSNLYQSAHSLPNHADTWRLLFDYCRAIFPDDPEQVKPVVKDIQSHAAHQAQLRTSMDWLDLYNKATMFRGAYDFDSYMLACESRREPSACFWLPRRRVLEGKHKIATQIQEFLDDPDAKFLGISLPPGTGKSTMIKFLLAFIAGRWPNSANMYISYGDPMVKMILDSEKAILTDTTEYAHNDIFPANGAPDISAEYATLSYRRPGDFPTLGLGSIGGSITGRTRANKFMITDDLVKNAEMARSPDRLAKLNADYRSTLTTRMIGKNVKQIMLGTIWSVHDPISQMRDKHEGDPRYKFINIPVKDEDGNSNFEYDHEDNYTKESIAATEEALDPTEFSALYMGRPLEKGGLAFSQDKLKFYQGQLPDGEPDNVFFYTDVAWGGGDNLSMPIAYSFEGDWYIHDVVYDKRDKTVTKPRVVGKILQHRARMGEFEANNGGDEYCADIARILKTEQGYSCLLTHKKAPSNMSKLARIEQHAPEIRNIYFLAEEYRDDDYRRFMKDVESFSFTAKNKNDDAPDSLAGLVDRFMNGMSSTKSRTFKRPI